MSNARNLADVISGNYDVPAGSLDNVDLSSRVAKSGDTMTGNLIVNANVGIGTSSPSQLLEVRGNAARIRITDTDTSGTTGIEFVDSATTVDAEIEVGNSTQYFAIKTAGSEAMRITSAGNVGIGTSSPAGKIDVQTGTNEYSVFRSTVAGADILLKDSGTTLGNVRLRGISNAMAFIAGGDERMRIDSAGRVTMPYQPAFFARTASNISNTGASSTFQYPIVDFNTGNHYNSSTHTFTAPVSGKYFFSAHCILNNYPTNNAVEAVFQRNNGTAVYFDRSVKTDSVANRYSLGGSAVILLSAGDTVKVFVYADTASSWTYESSSNFSGFLIG